MQNWRSTLAIAILILLAGGWYWYNQPKFVTGEKAPDFSFQTLTGETKRLAEFKGRYTLLHFWASWCGPCRSENKDLVQLYNKYHSATFKDGYGFEIISLGMETNPEAWRKAIASDRLIWVNHYTDLKRLNGLIAQQYRINEIPTTYLLNPEGMIIGVNWSVEQMDQMLSRKQTGAIGMH